MTIEEAFRDINTVSNKFREIGFDVLEEN